MEEASLMIMDGAKNQFQPTDMTLFIRGQEKWPIFKIVRFDVI